MNENVLEFAHRFGYLGANRLDVTYNNYEVYKPMAMNPAAMEGAHFILENDEEIRFSLKEESDDIRELLSVINDEYIDNNDELGM
ncbi:MAG: hypothetical protein MJ246_03490 [Clostridia bacterium]|nr:hypothetical protein [Clostridia bacterium]